MNRENFNFDYAKLRGRIVEKAGTQKEFANAMGWSLATVSLKMTGKQQWKQNEIALACSELSIEPQDIGEYFFTRRV